ncbi:MAG: 4-hydroxy-3-methylbut-2-enyl diphosphate reductase [Defluviitaleaceae bacterium]|nr:4-hydroxy-3-methylbut-2-enyl diphosphate reductase [Defluviitaleaceae bacterium]
MVTKLKESGFCYGVQGAVDRAAARLHEGCLVYLYGDLANNDIVMARLKSQGAKVANNISEIPPGAVVIIRAHGVPQETHNHLHANNIVEDCTCPKVKNIHKIVAEKSASGYKIIIIGKSGHPEVAGTYGWCAPGTAAVADSLTNLATALAVASGKICVVAQTTCKQAWWQQAVATIKATHPHAEIHDTLCNILSARLNSATELAKTSDTMIIVGDPKSANSTELYQACAAISQTHFASSLNDIIKLPALAGKIGLAGSASTPKDITDEIHNYLTFNAFLQHTKAEIETASETYLQSEIKAATPNSFIHNALTELHRQHQNGKRIRGAMIALAGQASRECAPGASVSVSQPDSDSGSNSNYLEIAIAYELFQTAILIHDDIIDRSHTRRGRLTIHAAGKEKMRHLGNEAAAHYGISQAICIGDYGLFLANKILANSSLPPAALVEVLKLFSQIQLTTLQGEIMDVALPYQSMDIFAEYESYTKIVGQIFEYKTAWYTLAGPMMLGAIAAGASETTVNLLRDIALPLGVAFQIKDDLLGIYGSEAELGKPALSDIQEKKQTLLYGYAYKHATPAQRSQLDTSYGNPDATQAHLTITREIFNATGAKSYCEGEITRLSAISTGLIQGGSFAPGYEALLLGLASYLMTRRT